MRAFEIVLLALNVLTLLLSFRSLSMRVWWGVVGIQVLVLMLHGVVEGFRYQMAFSYVFVLLLLGWEVAKSSHRLPSVKIPKVLRIVSKSFALILLVCTAFVAYTLPVFTLPAPTGHEAVGIEYVALVDESRTDPFRDTSTDKRELMVKVYYPAKPDDTKPFSPYFHGSTALLRALVAFYQMPLSSSTILSSSKLTQKTTWMYRTHSHAIPSSCFPMEQGRAWKC